MSEPLKEKKVVGAILRKDDKGHLHVFELAHQPDSKCELCGDMAECRPYGPNGENVCHPCGMKDEEAAKRQFFKHLDGG